MFDYCTTETAKQTSQSQVITSNPAVHIISDAWHGSEGYSLTFVQLKLGAEGVDDQLVGRLHLIKALQDSGLHFVV